MIDWDATGHLTDEQFIALLEADADNLERELERRGRAFDEDNGCELCGEPGDDQDPVAHFWDDVRDVYVMAHGQCGEDAGLRLA